MVTDMIMEPTRNPNPHPRQRRWRLADHLPSSTPYDNNDDNEDESRHPQSTRRTHHTLACRSSYNNTHTRPSTHLLAERRIRAMSGKSRRLASGMLAEPGGAPSGEAFSWATGCKDIFLRHVWNVLEGESMRKLVEGLPVEFLNV